MATLPATGQTISFGRVYSAFTNAAYPTAGGTNVSLSATLGANYALPLKPGGTTISLSATFGSANSPYPYPP